MAAQRLMFCWGGRFPFLHWQLRSGALRCSVSSLHSWRASARDYTLKLQLAKYSFIQQDQCRWTVRWVSLFFRHQNCERKLKHFRSVRSLWRNSKKHRWSNEVSCWQTIRITSCIWAEVEQSKERACCHTEYFFFSNLCPFLPAVLPTHACVFVCAFVLSLHTCTCTLSMNAASSQLLFHGNNIHNFTHTHARMSRHFITLFSRGEKSHGRTDKHTWSQGHRS